MVDARFLVGLVGNVISGFLFLSPVPTFYRIWRKRDVEQYSAAPYLATLVNCGLGMLYGLPMVNPKSILILTINGFGFAVETVYLLLFLIFSNRRSRIKVSLITLAEYAFIGILALLVLKLAHTTELRKKIIGSLASAGSSLMYASPLSVMKLVIRTKSVEYMPFNLSLFSFTNAACWFAYGLLHLDVFISVPTGIGIVFGVAQLALYATYYKSTQRILAARELAMEIPNDIEIQVMKDFVRRFPDN